MEFSSAILPEITLFVVGSILLLFLSIGLFQKSETAYLLLSFGGNCLSVLAAIFLYSSNAEKILFGTLQTDPSFLFVRITILAVSAVLMLMISNSTQLEDRIKAEFYFFVIWLAFFASVLILSRHLLVSYTCLVAISIISTILSALPFYGVREGEAALKFWFQTTVCFTLGFGAIIILATQMNDLSYDSMRQFLKLQQNFSILPVIILVMLPFWSISGIFPFHFISIDQNHGSIWPVQAIQTLLVQGAGVVALYKVAVILFYSNDLGFPPHILKAFATSGFLGAFYCGLGALTQVDTKRFAAYFSMMQWSMCMITLGNPSPLAVSATIFHFMSVCVGLTICFIVWGGVHEARKSDAIVALRGVSKRCLFECLILLGALISLAGLPPFMGFSAVLNMVGALFEQKNLSILICYVLILIIQLVVATKMITILFFEEADNNDGLFASILGVGTKARLALLTLIAPLIFLGVFWEGIWSALVERANTFIIY